MSVFVLPLEICNAKMFIYLWINNLCFLHLIEFVALISNFLNSFCLKIKNNTNVQTISSHLFYLHPLKPKSH